MSRRRGARASTRAALHPGTVSDRRLETRRCSAWDRPPQTSCAAWPRALPCRRRTHPAAARSDPIAPARYPGLRQSRCDRGRRRVCRAPRARPLNGATRWPPPQSDRRNRAPRSRSWRPRRIGPASMPTPAPPPHPRRVARRSIAPALAPRLRRNRAAAAPARDDFSSSWRWRNCCADRPCRSAQSRSRRQAPHRAAARSKHASAAANRSAVA